MRAGLTRGFTLPACPPGRARGVPDWPRHPTRPVPSTRVWNWGVSIWSAPRRSGPPADLDPQTEVMSRSPASDLDRPPVRIGRARSGPASTWIAAPGRSGPATAKKSGVVTREHTNDWLVERTGASLRNNFRPSRSGPCGRDEAPHLRSSAHQRRQHIPRRLYDPTSVSCHPL